MTSIRTTLPLLLLGCWAAGCAHGPSRKVGAASPAKMSEARVNSPAPARAVPAAQTRAPQALRAFRAKAPEAPKRSREQARALMHAELVLRHYHPRSGWTMYAFPGVTHLAEEAETAPLMLYAAYRQYQVALRALRGALTRMAAHTNGADGARIKQVRQRLLHALVVLRHDRAIAPEGVKRYWAYLSQVGQKLPGLY